MERLLGEEIRALMILGAGAGAGAGVGVVSSTFCGWG